MATSLRSLFISIIPPVSFATSVPDPIAIPKSALASAGASLIPSPTMATIFLSDMSFAIIFSFCSGRTCDITFLIPNSAAI